MADILKLLKDLSAVEAPEIKEYDIDNISDKEYTELKESINELRNNPLFNLLGSLVGINNDNIDSLLETVDKYREEKKKSRIKRPSETISTEEGLQIHKLVQEYIDTMIKPYNPKNGGLNSQTLNDAYAGLYEFACWVVQYKE